MRKPFAESFASILALRLATKTIVSKATGDPLDSFRLIEPGDFGPSGDVEITVNSEPSNEDNDGSRESRRS